jgi:hypothetical protein
LTSSYPPPQFVIPYIIVIVRAPEVASMEAMEEISFCNAEFL